MWGTHRQARVALWPWRPHDAGAIQSGAARLALLALGTCLPLVTLRDSVSLGRATGEPQMVGTPAGGTGRRPYPQAGTEVAQVVGELAWGDREQG